MMRGAVKKTGVKNRFYRQPRKLTLKELKTDQQITTLIGYPGNPLLAADSCIGYLIGKQLEKEFSESKDAVIKELIGTPLEIIIEISRYSDVLLIDEVLAGQEVGEILIFDINDICDHLASFYIHGMNLSEAISSGKQLGIPIPQHFFLAGIEVGGNESPGWNNDMNDYLSNSVSLVLQKKMNTIFQTLHSIISDFFNKIL
ncbi:MAG: hydrogenase maturation protease [Spirochaetales bacterium]|nr:hydrogenase maturation protease [Spirochaetales bacterium]